MRWMLFLLFFSQTIWAKPVVLLGYFDAFGKAPFNNSEKVALGIKARLHSKIDIKLCPLNTVFTKAYGQFDECLNALEQAPAMALALGEAACELKLEMVARNKDKTKGPDNEGEERKNTVIIPEADAYLGMRYPLPQMYCALSPEVRQKLIVSNNAGSFVCNNMAFQTAHYWPDIMFGFIHVPANNCKQLKKKTNEAIESLSLMIEEGVKFLDTHFMVSPATPHPSNNLRLPVTKEELKLLRPKLKDDQCLQEFFNRARGVDRKEFVIF